MAGSLPLPAEAPNLYSAAAPQGAEQCRDFPTGTTGLAATTYLSDFPFGKDMLLFPTDCLSFLAAMHF